MSVEAAIFNYTNKKFCIYLMSSVHFLQYEAYISNTWFIKFGKKVTSHLHAYISGGDKIPCPCFIR